LWENVRNQSLQQLFDIFGTVLQKAREEAGMQTPEDPLYIYRCHAALVRALEKRDVKKMQAAIKRHYATITDLMKRLERSR
jgi:DNA-binding FadR family transcriptional regulator